jgi:hypothetical protein
MIISHVNKHANGTVMKKRISSMGKFIIFIPDTYSELKCQCVPVTNTSHNKNGIAGIAIAINIGFK